MPFVKIKGEFLDKSVFSSPEHKFLKVGTIIVNVTNKDKKENEEEEEKITKEEIKKNLA